jgi:DNA-binding HxlR family transcriptional regulator/putative sterol carrier protein
VATSTKRTYGEACGVAHAGDLIGERWALLVIRELMLGPKRFTDLRGGIPRISPNVLTQRLQELEDAGIVSRRKLPPPAASRVYELTPWGRDLEIMMLQLGAWAARSPAFPREAPAGPDAMALMLKALFDSAAAGSMHGVYEVRIGEEPFRVEIGGGEIEIEHGGAENADAMLETAPGMLPALISGELPLGKAIEAGNVKIEGSSAAVDRFLGLFAMPEPVAAETAA